MKAMTTFSTSATIALLFTAAATAKDLRITVKTPEKAQGTVMFYANGADGPLYAMAQPENGSVMFRFDKIAADSLDLYIFQDTDGNHNLNLDAEGRPTEPCLRSKIELKAAKTEQTVELISNQTK